jgi:hypothetical protein
MCSFPTKHIRHMVLGITQAEPMWAVSTAKAVSSQYCQAHPNQGANMNNDYILAGQIDPKRLSTWKRSADWGLLPKETHKIKTPWLKYKQQSKKEARPSERHSCVSKQEKQYMREQLSRLDISIHRIAEMSGTSQSSIYAMYTSKGQQIRNRKTTFNKLYKTFWQIKPFNPDQEKT